MIFRSMMIAVLLFFAGSAAEAHESVPSPSGMAEAGLNAQMKAWNKGDLEGALAQYWDSENITWVNSGGLTKGFKAFADAMRTDYAENPEKMGTYSAELLERRDLAEDRALIVFRWRIENDGKRLYGGISTQIWEKKDKSWVVTLEHAS